MNVEELSTVEYHTDKQKSKHFPKITQKNKNEVDLHKAERELKIPIQTYLAQAKPQKPIQISHLISSQQELQRRNQVPAFLFFHSALFL